MAEVDDKWGVFLSQLFLSLEHLETLKTLRICRECKIYFSFSKNDSDLTDIYEFDDDGFGRKTFYDFLFKDEQGMLHTVFSTIIYTNRGLLVFLGDLTFDKARYQKSILMNAQSETMDQRSDFLDGEINDPIRPPEDFLNFDANTYNATDPGNSDDINVEEELIRPMNELSSQERTPSNSQQFQSARSIRSEGSDFEFLFITIIYYKNFHIKKQFSKSTKRFSYVEICQYWASDSFPKRRKSAPARFKITVSAT